jgi:hypothetical protein
MCGDWAQHVENDKTENEAKMIAIKVGIPEHLKAVNADFMII